MRAGSVWLFQTTQTPTSTEAATDFGGLLPVPVPLWVTRLVTALLVMAVAFVISRLLVRLLGRRIAQRFRRPSLTRTALRSIRVFVFIFALLTVMNIYGLRLADIALSVTVFSAVIGVILAPIVGSIISGMFLLADQPYEIGDMIELADRGQRGFVEDITLRHTKIFTLDNTFMVIPNGEIRQRDVINYSAEDPRTRLSQQFLVTYESDIAEARSLIERATQRCDEVIEGGPDIRIGAARYPASPTVYIDNFADHGILLTLRYWAMEPYKLLRVRSRIQTAVWDELDDADVEIAYPHSHLYFDETSGEMQVSLADDAPVAGDSQAPEELDEVPDG